MTTNVSPSTLVIDYVVSGKNLAKGFRTLCLDLANERQNETGNFPFDSFADLPRDLVVSGAGYFLRQSIAVFLNPTREVYDRQNWVDIGKKLASACQGNEATKGIKITCSLRSEHTSGQRVQPEALDSYEESVYASRSKTDGGADKYRFVGFQISMAKKQRVADAFDQLPYEGSTRADAENAYSECAAPALLGTERAISQDQSLKAEVTRLTLERKSEREETRRVNDTRRLRDARIIADLKDANARLIAELAQARFDLNKMLQADRKSAPKAKAKAKVNA